MVPADRIAVALDLPDGDQALALARELRGVGLTWFKVGLSLWIRDGHRAVRGLKELGARVFLDLKLHDIPHQVGLASAAVADLGVDLLTIHTAGGAEMCRAAVEAAGDTRVLGITVLTSLAAGEGEVEARAEAARAAGLHGVVCSPREVGGLRERLPAPFLLVTPGIRPAGAAAGDQKRTATPEAAVDAGSDLLVIGRPITAAASPAQAARELIGA